MTIPYKEFAAVSEVVKDEISRDKDESLLIMDIEKWLMKIVDRRRKLIDKESQLTKKMNYWRKLMFNCDWKFFITILAISSL